MDLAIRPRSVGSTPSDIWFSLSSYSYFFFSVLKAKICFPRQSRVRTNVKNAKIEPTRYLMLRPRPGSASLISAGSVSALSLRTP